MNALTDPAIIQELYRASEAGASIDVISRGICMLRPGVPDLSENIRVRSVLGRYLEHSRLFAFHADHTSSYFIGSADLMPRNLDHRIEIVVPVEDKRAQAELNATLETLLSDTEQAWELQSDGDLAPARAGEGRARPGRPDRADAPGTASRAPPGRVQQP